MYPSVAPSVSLLVRLSRRPPHNTFIRPSVRPSARPSARSSIRPSVCLSVLPSVRPSMSRLWALPPRLVSCVAWAAEIKRRLRDLPVLGKGCRSNSLIHAVYWWLLMIYAAPPRPHPYLAHNWKCSVQNIICCAIASQFVCSSVSSVCPCLRPSFRPFVLSVRSHL